MLAEFRRIAGGWSEALANSMLSAFTASKGHADLGLQVDQVSQHRDIRLVEMAVLDVAPFDAVNVMDRLDYLLLSDVSLIVLLCFFEVVRAQVPNLAKKNYKG